MTAILKLSGPAVSLLGQPFLGLQIMYTYIHIHIHIDMYIYICLYICLYSMPEVYARYIKGSER